MANAPQLCFFGCHHDECGGKTKPHLVRFRSRVVAAEYVDAEPEGAADRWERWNGNGEAFGDGSGVWRLTVGDRGAGEQEPETEEVHESDFLILCIGSFSGMPNIPALSHMADEDATALVKGKRITVVGSGKLAFEIAADPTTTRSHDPQLSQPSPPHLPTLPTISDTVDGEHARLLKPGHAAALWLEFRSLNWDW
ncbi:hypothetical protein TRIUR3_16351 [Triticum urartu]|uniref:Flavin-containing monooxygenase n=1 Tax=Triticum urartu TaxID=4572 RepID=M8AQE5_TRIUA|nr:hypothetical protein TRIUR3_16351 [Triticum urartu]